MNILSIETSCDETAISVVRADGSFPNATYTILGNALWSQTDIHAEYGGVFPALAKREHIKTIIPMYTKALAEAGMLHTRTEPPKTPLDTKRLNEICNHEEGLAEALAQLFEDYEKPAVDYIAVTNGPGLEPALWVGVNTAIALSTLFNIPVIPVNHMEGHVLASLLEDGALASLAFPALALLISGGHTEFVVMESWDTYNKVGATRDDAVGEAFDKVARLLGLPYPGGPALSKLARIARERDLPRYTTLPRPMINSHDLDTSFSGLKTAVRYAIADKEIQDDDRHSIAREFEEAVTDVLLAKTHTAVDQYGIQSLIIGGGVSANTYIRSAFQDFFAREYPKLKVHIPEPALSTDNSIMIALGGHAHIKNAYQPSETSQIRADGNLSFAK